MAAIAEPPALLIDAARDALDALQQTIQARTLDLQARHEALFASFRQRLEAAFASYSLLPEPEPFEPDTAPPPLVRRWDPLAVRKDGLLEETKQLFADLLGELEQADTEMFDAAFDQIAEEGFDRGLWQMALAGIDTDPYESEEPPDWGDLLADDTYNGMNWEDRLGVWGGITSDKVNRLLGASMLSGASGPDTLAGFSRLTLAHTQHISGLFGNEAMRTFAFAGLFAAALVGNDHELRTIWVCRTGPGGQLDPKVCPICAEKHLRVTNERPVDDSHPGCRCQKVRVPEDYVPTPQSFESFQARNR